ncbi:MAG: hypothetical protein M1829_001482 [Trizodia sp. TS-e1964]|nr:MAG: hypothetical protein M1829_001482 [Trizodia sp. TS-e1964]
MATKVFAHPKIAVLYWNLTDIFVKCPYCQEIHCHGVCLPGRRASYCHLGGEYEFIFPIDENRKLVGYEIEKRRARFVNIGVPPDSEEAEMYSPERDDLDNLAGIFASQAAISEKKQPYLNLKDDSKELTRISVSNGEPLEKRVLKWSHTCWTMAQTPTPPINLGRTALMEAALWGRIESVRLLLKAEANKNLKDHEGRSAIYLAQPAAKNQKESYRRSSDAAEQGTSERDIDR